jgi:hypothetical protein
MRVVSLGVVAGVLVTSLIGCSHSPDSIGPPDGLRKLAVAKLDAPATVAPGAPVDAVLTVEWGACVVFDHISEVRSGSQIELAAWGRQLSIPPGASCTGQAFQTPHTYRLEPPFPTKFTIIVQPVTFGVLLTRQVQVQ